VGAHKTVILKITTLASVRQGWQRNNGYLVKAGYPLFFAVTKSNSRIIEVQTHNTDLKSGWRHLRQSTHNAAARPTMTSKAVWSLKSRKNS